jgi:broad specificity phosphatase PhoE
MKLILLRHGETEEEKQGIILGRLPGTLSPRGTTQMIEAAAVIKAMDLHPETIIASDLARTADSAAIVGDELGLGVTLEPLACERAASGPPVRCRSSGLSQRFSGDAGCGG